MAQLNTAPRPAPRTHEGGPTVPVTPAQTLRRLVMANLLWEDQFYVDGVAVAEQIRTLIPKVQPEEVARIAVEAREQGKLRHVPLLLVREMVRHASHRPLVAATLARVIQRPDELTEFLALYWEGGKVPLAASVTRGLAQAFGKFDEYALAKYNRDKAIKLRDVLRLSHPTPVDSDQADLWRRLNEGELATPDTWEVQLSAGADKRATWERLIGEGRLGGLALLRNLRNMQGAGVPDAVARGALTRMRVDRILPFRFLAAARFAPALEPELEGAMLRSLDGLPKLAGHTIFLLDRSGSMKQPMSAKSDLTRYDGAAGLAILGRELCETCEVWTFQSLYSWGSGGATTMTQIPARRGFALRDALGTPEGGTHLGAAVSAVNARPHDRLIVLTDEESQDMVGAPVAPRAYMINVSGSQHAIGFGAWTRISGFSEAVLAWIQANEQPALA